MKLKAFKFSTMSPYAIERTWEKIKEEYQDAIFEQVITNGDSYYILAFI